LEKNEKTNEKKRMEKEIVGEICKLLIFSRSKILTKFKFFKKKIFGKF
jgi:hypothetical protein